MYFSDSQNALLHSSVHSSNTFCVYSCCQFHSGEFPNKLIISLICFALVDNSRPPSYTVDDFLCNSQESSARYHLSQFPLFSLLYFPTPVAPGIFSLTLGEFFFLHLTNYESFSISTSIERGLMLILAAAAWDEIARGRIQVPRNCHRWRKLTRTIHEMRRMLTGLDFIHIEVCIRAGFSPGDRNVFLRWK